MNNRIVKFSLYLVLIIVVCYGYAWYVAKTGVDSLTASLRDDVNISYKSLSVDFDGVVKVKDLKINPYLLRRSYSASELQLDFGGLSNMLYAKEDWVSGKIPKQASIQIFDVSGPLTGRDPEQILARLYGDAIVRPFGLFGCGDRERVGHDELQAMGINAVNMDIRIDYEFGVATSDLATSITIDGGELSYLKLDASWEGLQRKLGDSPSVPGDEGDSARKAPKSDIRLKGAELIHRDSGYFRRLGFFCSNETKVDRERFAVLAAIAWRDTLKSEMRTDVSDEIASAYALYLRDGGELSAKIDPPNAVNIDSLVAFPGRNLIEEFKVDIAVNSDQIRGGRVVYSLPPPPKPQLSEAPKPINEPKATYKLTEFEVLSQYVGSPVKVLLKSGSKQEGELVAVAEFGLELSRLVSGGNVKYQFGIQDIESIEVWRK